MSPKISIIVPVYKVEKYIDKCIKSILNQTFRDFELILVNDGSPDKCGEICNNYLKIDNRIKVINKENGGLSSARNAGLNIARGEYIGFIDSDDYINKNMYEILYNEAIKNEADITICEFQNVYENSDEVRDKLSAFKVFNYNNIEALEQLYKEKSVQFVVSWNKLYKKGIFLDVKYDEGKIHEDEFIIHKLLYKSKKTIFIPVKLYYYLQRENSIMQSKFNKNNLDFIDALEQRMIFFKYLKINELKYSSQYWYVRYLLDYFYKAKYNIYNCDEELKRLKKQFSKNLFYIIKNNRFNWKEKISWAIFCINDEFYDKKFNNK